MWFISNERDFSVGVKRQPNLWKKRGQNDVNHNYWELKNQHKMVDSESGV